MSKSDDNGTDTPDTPAGKEPAPKDNVTPFPVDGTVLRVEIANDVTPPRPPSEPAINLPPAVRILCLVLLLGMTAQHFMPEALENALIVLFGFTPGRFTGGAPLGISGLLTPLTHMFLHGSWLHVILNVGILMAFGAGVERALGAWRTLLLYFVSGVLGAFAHFAFYPEGLMPLIGASGGISGLFGGVLMLMYRQGMMGEGGYSRLALPVAVWVGISLFFGLVGVPGSDMPIAWTAHIGGFAAGLLLFNPVANWRRGGKGLQNF